MSPIVSRIALTLLIGASVTAHAQTSGELRLTPDELATRATSAAGTGTSGVAVIRTTVLTGDPTKAGLYSLRLTVPPNTRIAAHTHRDERAAGKTNAWQLRHVRFRMGARAHRAARKRSIALHAGIDLERPCLDATAKVVHALEAALREQHRRVLAAAAVMADEHQVAVRRQFGNAARELAERNRHRLLDPAAGELPGFAHVDQDGCRARGVVTPAGEIGRGKLRDQNLKRAGAAAFLSGATTVSNRSADTLAPGAVHSTSRAVIAGGSPTIAKTRPPGRNCANKASGSRGVEPVSTIAS